MNRTTASGSVDGAYVDDDPVNEITGTLLVAKDRNAIQEEIMAVIEAAGITPDANNFAQLLAALRSSAANLVDANKLNGQLASFYRNASNLNSGTVDQARLPLEAIAAAIDANAILAKLLTVDGYTSGIVSEDSAKLGGVDAANYVSGNANGCILGNSGSFGSVATRSGFYIFNSSTVSDLPTSEWCFGTVTFFDANTGSADMITAFGKKYARILSGGTWGSWILISSAGVAPDSAKVAGVTAVTAPNATYTMVGDFSKVACLLGGKLYTFLSSNVRIGSDGNFYRIDETSGWKMIRFDAGDYTGTFAFFSGGAGTGAISFDAKRVIHEGLLGSGWYNFLTVAKPSTIAGYGITDAVCRSYMTAGATREFFVKNLGNMQGTVLDFISTVDGSVRVRFDAWDTSNTTTLYRNNGAVTSWSSTNGVKTYDLPVRRGDRVKLIQSGPIGIRNASLIDDGTCSGYEYDSLTTALTQGVGTPAS